MFKELFLKVFSSCKTVNEIKSSYRKFALKYHPDKYHDDGSVFKILNEIYLNSLENFDGTSFDDHYYYYSREREEKIINLYSKYCNIPDCLCEIIGTWLWISGNTKPIKSQLKDDQFRWSNNKSSWYFHTGEFHKKSKTDLDLEDIRELYGCYKPDEDQMNKNSNLSVVR